MKEYDQNSSTPLEELIDRDLLIPRDKIVPGNIYMLERSNAFHIAYLDQEYIHAYLNCENPEYSYLSTVDNKTLKDGYKRFKLDPKDVVYEMSPKTLQYAEALFRGLNIFWNPDLKTVEKIFFAQDLRVLPLDKFLGVQLNCLYNKQAIGRVVFDILQEFEPKIDGNYLGLSGKTYRMVLPYSDETVELWQKYKKNSLKSTIESNFPSLKDYTMKSSMI